MNLRILAAIFPALFIYSCSPKIVLAAELNQCSCSAAPIEVLEDGRLIDYGTRYVIKEGGKPVAEAFNTIAAARMAYNLELYLQVRQFQAWAVAAKIATATPTTVFTAVQMDELRKLKTAMDATVIRVQEIAARP